jgi:hypothetical protein
MGLSFTATESLPVQSFSGFSESESHCDWRSVSQSVSESVLVSSPVWGSWPEICYCLTVTVLSLGGRPLWREDGSVVCQSVSSITSIVIVYSYIHFICFTWLYNIYIASVSPGSVHLGLFQSESLYIHYTVGGEWEVKLWLDEPRRGVLSNSGRPRDWENRIDYFVFESWRKMLFSTRYLGEETIACEGSSLRH